MRADLARRADDQVGAVDPLDLEHQAGEEEGVAGRQGRGEILLDRAELAAVAEADVEQRRVDDDAGVHPVLLDEARVARRASVPSGVAGQPLELVIGAQRIAAVLDEARAPAPNSSSDSAGIRRGAAHLGEHLRLAERRRRRRRP